MDILQQWWNLFFIASIGFSAILLAISMFGVGGDSDHDVDHDVDCDADADADVDADADSDVDCNTDTDADHDIQSDHHALVQAHSVPLKFLHPLFAIFGVGQMPISMIISTFCLVFGITGLISNAIAKQVIATPQLYFWFSLIAAFLVATGFTKITAKIFSSIFPKREEKLATTTSFLGNQGTAITGIDHEFGIIKTTDHTGIIQQLRCYTDEEQIGRDAKVHVIDYDEEKKVYLVRRQPPELEEKFQALQCAQLKEMAEQRRGK